MALRPNRLLRLPSELVRSQMLALGLILLVFAMVVTALAGFAYVSSQQRALTALRQQSQELLLVQQALTQADADVAHFVLGAGDLGDYYRQLELIKARQAETLDRLDAGSLATGMGAGASVAALQRGWSEAISFKISGRGAEAQQLLADSNGAALLVAVARAVDLSLADADGQFALSEERIMLGTLLVLLLQVGSGTLAIAGLVYAFRSSAAEATGRAAALTSADASREQLARLFDMADVLQSATDYGDANAVLKATAAELVAGFSGALYVFNNSRDRLVLSTSWERDESGPLPETINPSDCWALKRGKPHTNRADGSKLCCEHHASFAETALEIPMIARGEILGLLQLFASGADAERRLEGVRTMGSALADGMSLALANMALREKLRNQALRDPLTGLYNRRYMEDTLQRFVRLAEREDREVSVVMVDLDHFKRLNDEHGHAFGDTVLRETAKTIVSTLRETDVVCRYGGEELVVILPDCNIERAADKAEMIRLRIEELSGAHNAAISASFGVSSLPYTSTNISDLLAAADAALYKAKQAGRNQVAKAPLRSQRGERGEMASLDLLPLEAAE